LEISKNIFFSVKTNTIKILEDLFLIYTREGDKLKKYVSKKLFTFIKFI